MQNQTTKSYLGPPGVAGFNGAMGELIFGRDSDPITRGRVRTIQTPGGTAALRVGADLIRHTRPETMIWASRPDLGPITWLCSRPPACPWTAIPISMKSTSDLRYIDMMEALKKRGAGDVVLFHACVAQPMRGQP